MTRRFFFTPYFHYAKLHNFSFKIPCRKIYLIHTKFKSHINLFYILVNQFGKPIICATFYPSRHF